MEETSRELTLSVSQYNEYNRCAYAYYLHRRKREWQRPAAWLPQGTAFHQVAEEIEKGEITELPAAKDRFGELYAAHVGNLTETTPNLDWWFRSGPYGAEEDLPRRFNIGMEQIEKYWVYREKHPEERPLEDMIEFGFLITLDGIRVRGYIDQVYQTEAGHLRVRDLKTGNKPGDSFQLGTYAVAVGIQLDTEQPQLGDYWMARAGKPTMLIDLSEWTVDRITNEFGDLKTGIEEEKFDPDPTPDKCMFCPVANACEFRK